MHSDTHNGVTYAVSRARLCRQDLLVLKRERHRLVRELCDGPLQRLTGLSLRLDLCRQLMCSKEPRALDDELAQLQLDLHKIMTDVRELMVELRCPRLATLSLSDVVSRYARDYEERTGLRVVVDLTGPPSDELECEQKLATFRILQEAMRNVRRHARASEIRIRATRQGSSLRVSVEDDGEGFNLLGVTASYPRRGLGLAGMQERAKAVGEEVEIDSQLGQGTRVTLALPLRHQPTCSQKMLAQWRTAPGRRGVTHRVRVLH